MATVVSVFVGSVACGLSGTRLALRVVRAAAHLVVPSVWRTFQSQLLGAQPGLSPGQASAATTYPQPPGVQTCEAVARVSPSPDAHAAHAPGEQAAPLAAGSLMTGQAHPCNERATSGSRVAGGACTKAADVGLAAMPVATTRCNGSSPAVGSGPPAGPTDTSAAAQQPVAAAPLLSPHHMQPAGMQVVKAQLVESC
ncbi:hypothetical protein Agub_g14531 [Astrephomene gubernaculifera]|uniref:Uncharacterized protein n=1 Tax=Astrephomene gubernaculifera TaxID=47775 RepID=A0AAD3HT51_9CHLO|nr:hypothetical protein Agub_g14531 [Astrephomene gubernaculifera]